MIDEAISKVTGYLRDAIDGLQRDAAYPVPAYRITVDGNDIAMRIAPRLMSLQLTYNRGLEADQLSITLSDHDGLLTIPPRGAAAGAPRHLGRSSATLPRATDLPRR